MSRLLYMTSSNLRHSSKSGDIDTTQFPRNFQFKSKWQQKGAKTHKIGLRFTDS